MNENVKYLAFSMFSVSAGYYLTDKIFIMCYLMDIALGMNGLYFNSSKTEK